MILGAPTVFLGARRRAWHPLDMLTPARIAAGHRLQVLDPSDASQFFTTSAKSANVAATGDPIGAIVPAGNGGEWVQATAGARLIWRSAGGLAWMADEATTQFAAGDATTNDLFRNRSQGWAMWAGRHGGVSTSQNTAAQFATGTGVTRFGVWPRNAAFDQPSFTNRRLDADSPNTLLISAVAADTDVVLVAVADWAAGTRAYSSDGGTPATASGLTTGSTSDTASTLSRLHRIEGSSTWSLRGRTAALLLATFVPTAEEQALALTWAAGKQGRTL